MLNVADTLEIKFAAFCKNGEVAEITRSEYQYIGHCLAKCARPYKGVAEVSLSGHPMFVLWSIKYDGSKMPKFLAEVGKKYRDQHPEDFRHAKI